MLRNNILMAVVFMVGLSVRAVGQDYPPAYSQMVRIESDPEGAELYAGDSLIGTTPTKVHKELLPGMTAWYPGRNVWNASMQQLPETALSEIEGVLVLQFERTLLIQSIPGNAAVYDGATILGRTPLRVSWDWGTDTFYVAKPGFVQQSLIIASDGSAPGTVILEPLHLASPPGAVRELNNTLTLPPTRVLLASTVGLSAGVTAVILKHQADNSYDSYQQTGSPKALDDAERYDLYSGVSLAILQLALVYLIYELFITP